jgi:hypothetical protein
VVSGVVVEFAVVIGVGSVMVVVAACEVRSRLEVRRTNAIFFWTLTKEDPGERHGDMSDAVPLWFLVRRC